MCRVFLFLMGLLCLSVSTVMAQDPVKVDPKHYKVEFENDQVRVLRVTFDPHEKSTVMHEHPTGYVIVYLTDADMKATLPDGETEEGHRKAGQTRWRVAGKHQTENLSDKPYEVIIVEIKTKPAPTK